MDREIRSRRHIPYAVCAIACAALSALSALPASGWAASGGSGLTPGGAPLPSGTAGGSGTGSQPVTAQSGDVPVTASGNGITLQTTASALLRSGLSFSGTAPQSMAGDTIEIERSGHQTNWRWAPTVSATIGSDGTFGALWNTNHIGQFAIRAVISSARQAQTATATPSVTITVYRPSKATQYGPGFYGRKTACGVKLTRSTIGVANRTLKCGEDVALLYDGRTLVVPVIDRGPYANGADWDLTMATGRAMGIDG